MKKHTFTFLSQVVLIFLVTAACSSDDDTPEETIALEIGQTYQGGIIFYLEANGLHGLIASEADQGIATWGCKGNITPIAQNTNIGTGSGNTQAIVTACSEDNIAAKVCADLSLNGYDDWFLPSSDELEQLYAQKDVVGGFEESEGSIYVSSSEFFPVGTGQHLNC